MYGHILNVNCYYLAQRFLVSLIISVSDPYSIESGYGSSQKSQSGSRRPLNMDPDLSYKHFKSSLFKPLDPDLANLDPDP